MKVLQALIITMTLLWAGCTKDEVHTSIIGSWNCEEFSDIGPRIYQVSILRNEYLPNATNEYIIYNFHNLGSSEGTEVYIREIKPGELTITGTATPSISISGTGIVASDFTKIVWNYQVNDGITNPFVVANYY